ncbi:hypothetical protein [Methanosphaera cuniculi]|uniref:Uncharacterized protein n=1 Tax=Methanosphaera cuniculi TaxID=1077256 RepID=A0A2A2HDN6_9EURY|nr:hypothetical protein [Methanosphaera cuniculi]PAV07549.1 hypothetical protein ASJ82_07685 [Methanosphaera cuniculi]PWL08134.1 hypothetical protein MSCUN_10650 [Methanosphaera cuniculi]
MNRKEIIQNIENKIPLIPSIQNTLNDMTTYAEENIQQYEKQLNNLNKQLATLNNEIDKKPDNIGIKIKKMKIIMKKATPEKAIQFHKTILFENIELRNICHSIQEMSKKLNSFDDEELENLHNFLEYLCIEYVQEYTL